MKVSIVFIKNNEALSSGKSFEVQMSQMPQLNERVFFNYVRENEAHDELCDLLDEIKLDCFEVIQVNHYCAIDKISDTAGLIFLTPIESEYT